jgi:hypothetical protein
MKILIILLLSITSIVSSQTIGITLSPPRIGAGIFYNSKELGYGSTALFAGFDAGVHKAIDKDYTIMKSSIGMTYVFNRSDYSFSHVCSRIVGTICYNYIDPNEGTVNELSIELGCTLTWNKLVLLIMYDVFNHDAKIGIGKYFK